MEQVLRGAEKKSDKVCKWLPPPQRPSGFIRSRPEKLPLSVGQAHLFRPPLLPAAQAEFPAQGLHSRQSRKCADKRVAERTRGLVRGLVWPSDPPSSQENARPRPLCPASDQSILCDQKVEL